jgi:HK97 family phage portal protein
LSRIQKAVATWLLKAAGFPVWNTVGGFPGGWIESQSGTAGGATDLAVVYGCIRVLCTLGALPFHVYTEDAAGRRQKALDNPLYPILHSSPNAYMTSMGFLEALINGFGMFGNGYGQILKLGKRTVSLNPLRADRMRPMFLPPDYDRLVYRYAHYNGQTQDFLPEEILHPRNFSLDGLVGLTPIRKYAIEHGLAAQAYGLNFLKNQGRPSGVLSSDQAPPANEDTAKKMRADWDAKFAGVNNAGGTPVLWKGLKYEPISVPPDDAQYILTRQLSTAEIAGAIYGVPLNMLGHTDKTASYASAEQFDIQFVKHTVRPLAERIEQEFNKKLFASTPGTFCEFDLDALQRGDSTAQAAYFSSLVQNGIMTRNEARRKLNLPEIKGGDELTVQSNLIDLDKLALVTNRAALPQPQPTGAAQ